MRREYTNIIRFIMDEFIPPIIRDSKWFMYPFFCIIYKTMDRKKIERFMAFKTLSYQMSDEEYDKFCVECLIPFNRETAVCKSNIDFILDNIKNDKGSLVDVGCGKGYLLKKIHEANQDLKLCGVDVYKNCNLDFASFKIGNIRKTDFPDNHFDIVLTTHTLEHIIDVKSAFDELVRITKKKLIIVVPCQRYFYYTLDGHIQFFYKPAELLRYLPFKNYKLTKLDMDWIYIGYKDDCKN